VWRITEKLNGVAFGAWNRLTDVAAASPLVTGPAGSPNQFVVGAALSWRFEW
jgi:MipA family protein